MYGRVALELESVPPDVLQLTSASAIARVRSVERYIGIFIDDCSMFATPIYLCNARTFLQSPRAASPVIPAEPVMLT